MDMTIARGENRAERSAALMLANVLRRIGERGARHVDIRTITGELWAGELRAVRMDVAHMTVVPHVILAGPDAPDYGIPITLIRSVRSTPSGRCRWCKEGW